jgi:asparagine synthase (glutamine-hydrolysing)
VTLVFPGSDEAEETEWQRLVLDRLGLEDWVRLEFGDELDAIGPIAQEVMGRHGLVWPFNVHFHLPIMEAARGGSVVTGFAGDELGISTTVSRPERMLVDRSVQSPRDVAAIAYRLGPRPPRWPREFARAGRQIDEMNITWLTRRGRMALRSAFASDALLVPGWERILRDNLWRSRYFQVCKRNFQVVADHYDVAMCHPFVEPLVIQALGRAGGFAGLRDREQILDLLAGDLLPPEVITRQSKAVFGNSLWTDTAKGFARGWSGRGLDERLVDPEAVRRAWTAEPLPAILSTTMLQAAWLAENGGA